MEEESLSAPLEGVTFADIREAIENQSPIMDTVNNLRAIFPGGPINPWIDPDASHPDILGGRTFTQLRNDVDSTLQSEGLDTDYILSLNTAITESGEHPEAVDSLYRELVSQTFGVLEKLVELHGYKLADLLA